MIRLQHCIADNSLQLGRLVSTSRKVTANILQLGGTFQVRYAILESLVLRGLIKPPM